MLKAIQIRARPNGRWRNFFEDRVLTLEPAPIVGPGDSVFTMGSCFAREIRSALRDGGVVVGPDYGAIPVDAGRYMIDELPRETHLNYYNTFTIRQEFERIAGRWRQADDDFWRVRRSPFGGPEAFQDPYKRLTFGRTPGDLRAAIALVDAAIDASARTASVFFFTLGMAEVFRKKDNGLIACQKPAYLGGGGERETELHLSGFAENLANLEETRAIIKALNPDARIVVTVSPVPLERTFSGRDIVVANQEGKATLRACAGEFARAHDDVFYYPAYEIVTMGGEGAFQARDRRHVDPDLVSAITRAFIRAHVVPAAASGDSAVA